VDLSLDQFRGITKLVYQKLGLHFDENKIYFIKKRVEKRMQELGIHDPVRYLYLLGYADPDGAEMQKLANLVTTNETYMFREFEQLQGFADHCLPEVLSGKQAMGNRKLRIWSAGCSSGEEPYTLAIIVREVFPQIQQWDFQIIATDIDENMLERTRNALYDERSVREVPLEYQARHLIPVGIRYRIHPNTAAPVRIKHVNLHDRIAMRGFREFDFIFCRNVLIYFDELSRRNVVDHFYNALNPGGYVFLGHSESMGRISPAFKLKRMEDHLVYVKA
jgi:chemotaxis protein methyltransferase CheR